MIANIVCGQNRAAVDYTMREISKMQTKQLQTEAPVEHPLESVGLTREQEIEQIVNEEYQRERAFGKEVVLLSPDFLTMLGETGQCSALSHDAQLDLKKDIGAALKQFSPAERHIIFRVFVQGQSIDLATKGSRFSTSFWKHRISTYILPKLRESLKDYCVNGKVVMN